jgi:FkbM family methyltransferase
MSPDQRVTLADGLMFEVGTQSRIEQALLERSEEHPDHVWEPQTTRLLKLLGRDAPDVIIGGAYIGDHALPVAREMTTNGSGGTVHAFEPMLGPFERLEHHKRLNDVVNLECYQMALWDRSGVTLSLAGDWALASASDAPVDGAAEVAAVTIDDFAAERGLRVGLIHLDLEGGEERALRGASGTLARPIGEAPHLTFEVHREHVDWSDGLDATPILRFVLDKGYTAWAVRDFHGNVPMEGRAIEIVPTDDVYLEGPPHGFNMLATKDPGLVERLGLRIVGGVSPKLLWDKDPVLHHPRDPWPRDPRPGD